VNDLFAAIGIVFLAELGDKTQLVALGFGARYRLGPVLAGVALGYAACNVVSVVVGGLLGAALPTRAIGIGGGLLFLAFAAWTWFGDDEPEPEPTTDPDPDDSSAAAGRSTPAVVGSVAVAMFVAELGDKTMIATATSPPRATRRWSGSGRPWASSSPAPSACWSGAPPAPASRSTSSRPGPPPCSRCSAWP
jgi:putative Ca2+/H+ antiporter (TMEM165/GDT1 family)